MSNEKKLTTVSVPVPFRGAGNTIRQNEVVFDVFAEGDSLRMVPLLDTEQRRVANLPPELVCHISEGRPVSSRGHRDGNQHVIEDVFRELRSRDIPLA